MRQGMKLSLAVMFFLAMVSSTFAAETKVKDLSQLGAANIYDRVMRHINKLEQKAPGCQLEIFELRDEVEKFYDLTSVDYTDPVNKKTGIPLVADLSRGSNLYDSCKGLKGDALRRALNKLVDGHHALDYKGARQVMFTDLDNVNGEVECVYTGRKIMTKGIPSSNDMNCEHSWPQSKGATGDAKTDLHHLFPADSKANSIRGNHPFGYVKSVDWSQGGSKFDKGESLFEIRPQQRGNTARGMFYFAVRYNQKIDAAQEKVLREWNKQDPVDEYERKRNDRIQNIQNNRNPFVDHPEFIDLIEDF